LLSARRAGFAGCFIHLNNGLMEKGAARTRSCSDEAAALSGSPGFIPQSYPAVPQVSKVRGFSCALITPHIQQARKNVLHGQGLAATASGFLSGKCGIRGFWLRSTLRYMAG
jgi:hypothetical protein